MESSPIRDMLVENNRFIGCGVVITSSVKSNYPDEPVHENIRILNNTFEDLQGPVTGPQNRQGRVIDGFLDGKVVQPIQAKHVKGLVVQGNRANESPDPVSVNAEPSCSDLQIEKK